MAAVDIESVDAEISRQYQQNEKITNEEYKIWKKTVPLLYDTIQTHALAYPSLTCQWLPSVKVNGSWLAASLIYGTNTSGYEPDHLIEASVMLPTALDGKSFGEPTDPPPPTRLTPVRSWTHLGEVNKARVSPDSRWIATLSNTGSVFLFDRDASATTHAKELRSHTKEGYALAWVSPTQLLSGTDDSTIAHWDVAQESPLATFTQHTAAVNDVASNPSHPFLFGSASDDHTHRIFDLRANHEVLAHTYTCAASAFAFHPEAGSVFATGTADMVASLWDMRKPEAAFRQLHGHTGGVTNVEFSGLYLMSNATDKRVNLWNLGNLGEDFDSESYILKNEKGVYYDPCLEFVHAGHTYRVNDMGFHPTLANVVVSVGDDSLLEVWKMHVKEAESG